MVKYVFTVDTWKAVEIHLFQHFDIPKMSNSTTGKVVFWEGATGCLLIQPTTQMQCHGAIVVIFLIVGRTLPKSMQTHLQIDVHGKSRRCFE